MYLFQSCSTCSHGDSKPFVNKTAYTQDRTTHRKQLEHGPHRDSLAVHIDQLEFHFQRTQRFNRRTCRSQKCPSLRRTRFRFAWPRTACSSRIHQKLDVVDCARVCPTSACIMIHYDWSSVYVKQCTSPPPLELALFDAFLLRTVTREVTNLIAIVASTFLLGVTILGFLCFSLDLSCLSFLSHSLCWFDTNSLSQSAFSSSTRDRQHPSRVYSDPLVSDLTRSFSPWQLFVFQLPSGCTCRTLVSSIPGVLAKRHLAKCEAQLPT